MISLDQKDLKILRLLLNDGRLSYEKIAKNVDLTPITVKNRITQLIHDEIITDFKILVNPKILNYSVCYSLAYLKGDPNKHALIEQLGDNKNIMGGHVNLGNYLSIIHTFKNHSDLLNNIQFIRLFEEIERLDDFILLFPEMNFQNVNISKNDWLIINALKNNCRKSDVEVAEELNITAKTVKHRLKYLKNNGIIIFMVNLDTSSGNLLTYNPIIKFKSITSKDLIIINKIVNDPFYIWRITNEEAMIYSIYIKQLRDLEEQILKIKQMENVIEIINLVPTKMYFFKSWIDDLIEDKAQID
ncbi:MAG: winged helix-turn-helix transcriptional regulator [Candidatus Lokiarchaeota archaeon]|nr:winged helix-turn-helix transcriptional regulator [Candidatus Lokiarchaeota archaeon]